MFRIAAIDQAVLRRECDRALALVRAAVPQAEVREVGSTAIPGVLGKQDIDLLVRVPEHQFEATRASLDAAFSRNPNQISNARYQGYAVLSELDVAIQLTINGCEYDSFVQFLDALRAEPELIERYNALKRSWDGRPMSEYRAAKAAFIDEVLHAR